MLPRAELVALVERLLGEDVEEAEADEILGRLREHLPHPALADSIYLPEQVPGFPHPEPTAEQVVDFAAAYRPRPLLEAELAEVLARHLGQAGEPTTAEDVYRLGDTRPDFDWAPALRWARLRQWSGADLARHVLSGQLEGDPTYQGWVVDVFAPEAE